tara:strand:+ start:549 stop:1826 length:1278 start_codon:yes stop_codon:yes gene_type:complete
MRCLLISFFLGLFLFISTVSFAELEHYKISLLQQKQEVSIQTIESNLGFEEVKEFPLNFGIATGFYWLKIERRDTVVVPDFLTIGTSTGNRVNFYGFSTKTAIWEQQIGGEFYSDNESSVTNVIPSFDLRSVNWEKPLYVLIATGTEHLVIPLKFYTTDGFYSSIQERIAQHSLLYGFLLVIMFLNGAWYFISRDKASMYFAMNMFFFILYISFIDGYLQKKMLMGWTDWYSPFYYTMLLLGTITALKFGQTYLRTKEDMPKIHLISNLGLIIVGVGYFLSWFEGNVRVLAHFLIFGNNLLLSFVYLAGAIQVKKHGHVPGDYMLYALTGTVIFSNLFVLQYMGVIPSNVFTLNGVHIGYSIFGVGITLGLLVRYKALLTLQKQDEIDRRVELELRVEERVNELSESIRELAEAHLAIKENKLNQ